MITKAKIFGKIRELWSDGDDNWFLTQPKDNMETGIFCGNPLARWNDHNYLSRIAARL